MTGVRSHRVWLAVMQGVVLVGAAFAVYWPALHGAFIWDDKLAIVENPLVAADDGLQRLWFTTESWDYWPLTYTTYWIERRVWDLDTLPYHVLNVLLHAGVAILVWRVLRRLAVPGAWVIALLFCVHPVNVESVAWVVQRKTLLAALFFFASWLCYLHFDERRRRGWYAAALVLFVLSLLSKTTGIMLPVLLLGTVWYRRGRIGWRSALESAPFFVIATVLGLVNVWFQMHRAIAEEVVRDAGVLGRLLGAAAAFWFYVGKAVAPFDLMPTYPRWTISTADWRWWLPLGSLIATVVLLWLVRRRTGRGPLFALSYIALALLPVLGFVDIYFMRYSLVADHWQYNALVGTIALVVAPLAWLVGRAAAPGRWAGPVVVCVVAGALGVLTWRQAQWYQDAEQYWRNTLARNPDATVAHANLGELLLDQGNVDEALAHTERALALNPGFADLHHMLGRVLERAGDVDGALRAYHESLALAPNYARIHADLGRLLLAKGETDEAVQYLRRATELDPRQARAQEALGMLLQKRGAYADAKKAYEMAVRFGPNNPRYLSHLAWLLATCPDRGIRDPHEALGYMRRATVLTMFEDVDVLDVRAAVQAANGRFALAERTARLAASRAMENGRAQLAGEIAKRAALYAREQVYLEPAPTTRPGR